MNNVQIVFEEVALIAQILSHVFHRQVERNVNKHFAIQVFAHQFLDVICAALKMTSVNGAQRLVFVSPFLEAPAHPSMCAMQPLHQVHAVQQHRAPNAQLYLVVGGVQPHPHA